MSIDQDHNDSATLEIKTTSGADILSFVVIVLLLQKLLITETHSQTGRGLLYSDVLSSAFLIIVLVGYN